MENLNSRIPTNDEVIDEITKNLEQQTMSNNSSDDYQEKCIPDDFEELNVDEEPTGTSKDDDDYINEAELKKINDSLSPQEKEERLQKANESKYTEALRLYPLESLIERSIVYSNRAASKIHLGYKETAVDDCTKSIELNPNYIRAILRRAKLYEEIEKLDESLEDYKKLLELDPGNKDALIASQRLPSLINERNEKLKTEMLGKLKDLGNMILKPFGLSTNNFQLQQDPNTGSYSVNFQQKN
ncbi:hypothetical protein FQR65_LT07459 [Abscondita terminalis]|nr:hypothetical protein FQR65_LT07459 [Abscondita terminalis]